MVTVTVAGMPAPNSAAFSEETDATIARAIAKQPAGSATAAEEELYRRFARRVWLYGLKHLRDSMAAQDLVQQVMMVTIERLRAGEVRNLDQIGSFVLGMSRMMATGSKRTERRRETIGANWAHTAESLSEQFSDAVDLDAVKECLDKLPERERTVVILTYYAERSAPDIGATLGLTAGAVRVIRHRAVTHIREYLNMRRRV